MKKWSHKRFLAPVRHIDHTLLAVIVAVVVVVGLYVVRSSQAATIAPVQARTAVSFLDSLGVNIHMGYDRYSDATEVLDDLHYLGITHTRNDLGTTTAERTRLDTLKGGGIRFDFLAPRPPSGVSGIQNVVNAVKTRYLSSTDSIEGPNEYDYFNTTWVADLKAYQANLYNTVKTDSVIHNLPVLGPSLRNNKEPGASMDLGDIAGLMDYGNIHSYPGGHTPEISPSNPKSGTLEYILGVDRQYTFGAKPAMVTESGYTNALNNCTSGHLPATERTAGIYTPRMYLEYFRLGIVRTYDYALLDSGTTCDAEQHFGLFRADTSAKPAADAIHNMTTLLSDSGTYTPGSLKYAIASGAETDLHQVLLEKHDGTFWLALWRNLSVANPAIPPVDTNPADTPLVVSFGQPVASAVVYKPNIGTAGSAPILTPAALNLSIGASVTLVKVVAGATATPTPPDVTGDMDANGSVNVFDLSYLLSKWGTADTKADMDHNGAINVFDLSALLSHWTG